jgi:hypothetical protein
VIEDVRYVDTRLGGIRAEHLRTAMREDFTDWQWAVVELLRTSAGGSVAVPTGPPPPSSPGTDPMPPPPVTDDVTVSTGNREPRPAMAAVTREQPDDDAAPAEPPATGIVPVYSLTDPDTWRMILEQGHCANRSLTYMWKKDLAPLLGIPYPLGNDFIEIEIREDIVPRLKAFGVALRQFKIDNFIIKSVVGRLYNCDVQTFFPMIKEIESVIRNEQNKHPL